MVKDEKSATGKGKVSRTKVRKKETTKVVKKAASIKKSKKPEYRDIGIEVSPPKRACDDPDCPFHGTLSVRGRVFEGKIKTAKMEGTVVVESERLHYVKKFERYERRYKKFSAHAPPCMDVDVGKHVKIMECRPLSKTVSFVVVEVMEE